MVYFTIYHVDGTRVGGEFGRDKEHALDRYSEGSIYARDQLRAVRGHKL